MAIDSIEYSVCEDCWLELANRDGYHDIDSHIKREIGDRNAHFVLGVPQTEEDPEGLGYEEFSWCACELCNSTLGGSRHGITLLIQVPEPETPEPTVAELIDWLRSRADGHDIDTDLFDRAADTLERLTEAGNPQ